MQVFKLYFRIIQKNLFSLSIYLGVFIILTTMFSMLASESTSTGFQETRSRIAVINEDEGAVFAQGLHDYLGETARQVDIQTDLESMQDALFFREVEYILRIPKGYSDSFLHGSGAMLLEKSTVPDSTVAIQMDVLLARYLDLARVYTAALPETEPQVLVDYIRADLEQTAEVSLVGASVQREGDNLFFYFNYFSYSIMAIMVLGVTAGMLVMNNISLRRRNAASPLKNTSLNLQLVLGNLVFALVVWAVMCAFAFILYSGEPREGIVLPLMANALVYTLVCLSLSFLVGHVTKSRNAQAAIANVLSLGLCFISGVFVPQELLSSKVQGIGSFTPTYWYVKAVNGLSSFSGYSGSRLEIVVYPVLIQLGFAVAFLALALAVARYKSTALN